MKAFPDIDPKPFFCITNEKLLEMHLDEYNRVYFRHKVLLEKYNDTDFIPLRCHYCDTQVHFYHNYIGMSCPNKECHKITMEESAKKLLKLQKQQQRQ